MVSACWDLFLSGFVDVDIFVFGFVDVLCLTCSWTGGEESSVATFPLFSGLTVMMRQKPFEITREPNLRGNVNALAIGGPGQAVRGNGVFGIGTLIGPEQTCAQHDACICMCQSV